VFGSLIDELKSKVDGMLKLAVAGAVMAAALVAAFMCFTVALFLWMQEANGTLEAWMAVGALFAAVAALGGLFVLIVRRRSHKPQQRSPEPSAVARLLQEPAVLLTGLQLVRMVGGRGLLPIILLGAVAGGLMMNRNGHASAYHRPAAEHPADEATGD